MKTELFIATRYLFSKKRHNTINLITWISMGGVAIGTMALICVMSVLNGFEKMIGDSFSNFDPDLKIVASKGISIDTDNPAIAKAKRQFSKNLIWSEVIEQDGLVATDDKQMPVKIKGIDEAYNQVNDLEDIIWSGNATFGAKIYDNPEGIMGISLAQTLSVSTDGYDNISIYVPKNRKVNLSRPDANFTKESLICVGIFYSEQAEYDDKYIIMPISTVRAAYQFDNSYINAYELKIRNGNPAKIQSKLSQALGNDFKVLNRREQKADFYKISQIEKWSTFMILSFIMLIATFNIIGSMSMIIIEKKNDIQVFNHIGATGKMIKNIFRTEGIMIAITGAIVGLVLGIIAILLQQEFGFLKINSSFASIPYPVQLKTTDLFIVVGTILLMGYLAAEITVHKIKFAK